MTDNKFKPAPEPTVRRLSRYYHLLTSLKEEGINDISSTTIANEIGVDPTLVRKDIEYMKVGGKPKTGFNVNLLLDSIRSYLNWVNPKDAFLVGCGSLGTAMLGYGRFKNYGMNFLAAFDVDDLKIGTTIHDTPVFELQKLTELAKRMEVQIGVITTPAHAAQSAADLFVEGGIKAIWNFAPIHLRLPENIILENAQLTQSLAVLTRNLIHQQLK